MKQIKAAIISVSGISLTDDEKYLLARENPLGVALFVRNIQTPTQLSKLTKSIKETIGRHDVLIAVDQEGGRVCRLAPPYFRTYLAQSAIGQLNLEKALLASALHAELIAHDLHKVGINCNFAPTLDVVTPHLTKALKSRCFSKDPVLVTKLAQIMIEAYHHAGILSCIKHLPGHSGAKNDPHLKLSVIPKIDERYLYPFEQLSSSALMAMTAHIVVREIDHLPVTLSAKAIHFIRNQIGFGGLLISDALEMKALSGTLAEKALVSRQAGIDAVSYCKGDYAGVKEVLNNCGYLDDSALSVLNDISTLIAKPYAPSNISGKAKQYRHIIRQAPQIIDDYDAVEVLNQL